MVGGWCGRGQGGEAASPDPTRPSSSGRRRKARGRRRGADGEDPPPPFACRNSFTRDTGWDPDAATQGQTTNDGAENDSKLEPYGFHWQDCADTTIGGGGTGTFTESFANKPDGYYTFAIRCTNGGGNGAVVVDRFKIDTDKPVTTIKEDVATNLKTFDPSASDYNMGSGLRQFLFDFTVVDYYGSSDSVYSSKATTANWASAGSGEEELGGMTYECKIDDGAFAACGTVAADGSASYTTPSLAVGSHTLQVRAKDKAGNQESTPAFYSFTIENYKKNAGCKFDYSLSGPNAASASASTDTTKRYTALSDGTHTFEAVAIDESGNKAGTKATIDWEVDRTPPTAAFTTKTYGAGASKTLTSGEWEWSFTSETGATYSDAVYSFYSIDGSTYQMTSFVTSGGKSFPAKTVTLGQGTYSTGAKTFKVYGKDALGNAGAAVTDSFTVEKFDTTLGCTHCVTGDSASCTGTPTAAYATSSVMFDIGSRLDATIDPPFKYEYNLDSTGYVDGQHIPKFGLSGLSEGMHTMYAKARSKATGDVDPTPACVKFSVDLTKPVVTIDTTPAAVSKEATVTVSGSVTDANVKTASGGTEYKLTKIDAAGNTIYATSYTGITTTSSSSTSGAYTFTLTDLTDGKYTVTVKHTDTAGNTSTEATYTWIVDNDIPVTYIKAGDTAVAGLSNTVKFGCSEEPCTYEYYVDGGSKQTAASAEIAVTVAGTGVHTVEAYAVDVAGNLASASAAFTWTVSGGATPDCTTCFCSADSDPTSYTVDPPSTVQIQ